MVRRTILNALVCLAVAGALAGCSTSGGRVTLFPAGHKLIEQAKILREVSGPPPTLGRELNKHPAEPWIVEPGDVLLVQPASLGSTIRLPGDQPVLPDGTIKLGRYGPLLVAGKNVELIEQEVNDRIKPKTEDDKVIVRLVGRESKVYYVLGEVNAPGSFQLKGRETVLDAIVAAGGLTSNASRCKILLSHPTPPDSCRVVLAIDYNAIVQLGDTTTNYQIRAGDRVYVPSRSLLEDLKALSGKDPCWCGPPAAPCYPAMGSHDLPPPYPAAEHGPFNPPAANLSAPAPAPAPAGIELGNPVPSAK
jgi:protein involved in polysaccharide export with SLBB domain